MANSKELIALNKSKSLLKRANFKKDKIIKDLEKQIKTVYKWEMAVDACKSVYDDKILNKVRNYE